MNIFIRQSEYEYEYEYALYNVNEYEYASEKAGEYEYVIGRKVNMNIFMNISVFMNIFIFAPMSATRSYTRFRPLFNIIIVFFLNSGIWML